MAIQDDHLIPAPIEDPRTVPGWKRAGLKLVPYIGDALDELVLGHVDEARWDRLNQTLSELGESMHRLEIPADAVKKEDFAQLLEVVAPAVGRTNRVGRGHDVASRPPPSHTTVRTVPYTAVHEKYLSLRCS